MSLLRLPSSLALVAAFGTTSSVGALNCYCLGGHCAAADLGGHNVSSSVCRAKENAKCFAAVEEVLDPVTESLVAERTYGCLPPDDESGLFQCQGHLVPHLNPKSIACCSNEDQCNKDLRPMYDPSEDGGTGDEYSYFDGSGSHMDSATFHIALLISLTICLVIFIILVTFAYVRYKRREDRRKQYLREVRHKPDSLLDHHSGTLTDLIDQSSGSGSGLPLLVQRTIAKQIQMVRSIGKGRYGEVYLATWRGEKVAVKVFFTMEEASWFRETEIYQTVLMRHDNILGFIAADIKGTGGWTQMLLITDYHDNGSLHDYLKINTLDYTTLLRFSFTVTSGLSHLHTEIFGTRGKPAIAHRDIKTKNILVKRDGTCSIADFGLAVRYDSEKNEVDVGAPNPRVGTRRYMSPEVLGGTLNTSSFQAFLSSDVYSLGLMFWECARRTALESTKIDDYALPYFDYVNPDPSIDDMYSVVCLKDIRPTPSVRWSASEEMISFTKIMVECWHPNPSARLTALRIKKSISSLRKGDPADLPFVKMA